MRRQLLVRSPLLLLVLLLGGPAGAGDMEEENARFIERVNDAIDRGMLWVAARQNEDGSWPGYEDDYPLGVTALALLTLLKCDYPRKAEKVQKAFRLLAKRYRELQQDRLKTYEVAILMMAMEEAHAPRVAEKQGPPDRYGRPRHERRVDLPQADFAWMADMAKWMVSRQTDTVWRYPAGGIDHSNTQYALLGLIAARRCGVDLGRKPFIQSANHLLDAQEKDGPEVRRIIHMDAGPGYAQRYATNMYDRARGWGYMPGDESTGSMTTSGVSCLAICRSELLDTSAYKGPFGERMERGIRDGLAWLATNFAVDRNPSARRRGGGWHYYYLFGLERTGALCDVKFFGDHEWYREGATYLVANQGRDGAWQGGDLVDTCFALLFLRRATVPVRVPREVTPAAEPLAPGK
ncbi:MAG: hypothetical protein MUE73_06225 [Planctomycetes bacterium]|nr:hypothetical protein [Planctomycetota bacterium]